MQPSPAASVLDPAMPWLDHALRRERAEPVLRRLLRRRGLAPVRLDAIRLLRHKPGRRALVAYELCVGAGTESKLTLLGKTRARGLDRKTYACVSRLRVAGLAGEAAQGVAVPEPFGLSPSLAMWFQRAVDGRHAMQALSGSEGVAAARRIADAVHCLHRHPVAMPRRHGVADELAILETRLSQAAGWVPASGARVERVLAACREAARCLPEQPETGIHRDLYPDQVLLTPGCVHLLDLDLYCRGAPALDVGNFLAHLVEYRLRTPDQAVRLRRAEHAFEQRYRERAPHVAADTIRIWQALSLARHLHIALLFPQRRAAWGELLRECEARFAIVPPPRH